jgi:AcrR family transcriptional regulator
VYRAASAPPGPGRSLTEPFIHEYPARVARPRPPDRFARLRDAALAVFAAKGLHRARMSDVARAMGVSTGSLYNYVASKEALFHWIVELGGDAGPAEAPARLPIPTPPPGATEKRLREALAEGMRLPALDAALARRRVRDARAELLGIAREFYERVEKTRGPGAAIERSAIDQPELHEIYFREARRSLFAALERYVARRTNSGHFPGVGEPAVAARFLVESIVWFARHRFSDADPDLLPDPDTVRDEVLRRVVASFAPEENA